MTEHRGWSEQPLLVHARHCVTLPAIPAVYGLHHPEDNVVAWVFALPGGQAVIVPSCGDGTAAPSRWASQNSLMTNHASSRPRDAFGVIKLSNSPTPAEST